MKSRCFNCGWVGEPLLGLEEIVDLLQRIEPGGEVPSGECRKCDALCYLVKEPAPKKPQARKTTKKGN